MSQVALAMFALYNIHDIANNYIIRSFSCIFLCLYEKCFKFQPFEWFSIFVNFKIFKVSKRQLIFNFDELLKNL